MEWLRLDFDEYQKESYKTACYPYKRENLVYTVMGLVGEVGEMSDKIAKHIRDKPITIYPDIKKSLLEDEVLEIKKELGDILWFLSATCTELELSLNDVAVSNINKLMDRQKRNKIKGEGDNR